jgi:hypothetical protein
LNVNIIKKTHHLLSTQQSVGHKFAGANRYFGLQKIITKNILRLCCSLFRLPYKYKFVVDKSRGSKVIEGGRKVINEESLKRHGVVNKKRKQKKNNECILICTEVVIVVKQGKNNC